MDHFLRYCPKTPNVEKKDILDYFAYRIFCLCEWFELDSMIADDYDYMLPPYEDNPEISAHPTYAGEYFGVMGQLFLGGMIDFGIEGENLRKEWADLDTNLSKIDLGMSLYEKWIYFRDNFFYKKKFSRSYDEDRNNEEGYSVLYSCTSWDKPDDWSQYNILVALTPKGKQYLNETLAPKFYEKYKDVEIYLDDEGNIIGSNADTAVKA